MALWHATLTGGVGAEHSPAYDQAGVQWGVSLTARLEETEAFDPSQRAIIMRAHTFMPEHSMVPGKLEPLKEAKMFLIKTNVLSVLFSPASPPPKCIKLVQ